MTTRFIGANEDAFLEAGFIPTLYDGQKQSFLTKKVPTSEFLKYREVYFEDDGDDCEFVIVELTEDGLIQYFASMSDFEIFDISSDEGVELAKFAGVKNPLIGVESND